jgi:hypothetical protein
VTRFLPDLLDDPLRLVSTCPLRAAWMARDPAAEVEVVGGLVLINETPRMRIRVLIGGARFQLTLFEAQTCAQQLLAELVPGAAPYVDPQPLSSRLLAACLAAMEAKIAEIEGEPEPDAGAAPTIRMADPYFQSGEAEDAA